ncbi:MAG: Hsp20/alpha crystallin family protein [bacterium]
MVRKGLKDIKTIRDVSKPRPTPREQTTGQPKAQRMPSGMYQPRTWVFAREPRFERYQRRSAEAEKSLLVDKVKEPYVNIFEETESVVVIADLPGVEEKEIELKAIGDILLIEATGENPNGKRKYSKELLLPFRIDPKKIDSSFKNGILEIILYPFKKLRRNK